MTAARKTSWQQHLKQTQDAPPSHLLIEALSYLHQKEEALDLGAGGLKDTKYLLSCGFTHVTAVDREPFMGELAKQLSQEKLTTIITPFDKFSFPATTYDLINAQFALPFNPRATFVPTIERLKRSLKPRGVFCGQLFGCEDEWNTPTSKLTFHTHEEVQRLFQDIDLLHCEERIRDGKLSNGTPKHWHLFHIIAKKPVSKAS